MVSNDIFSDIDNANLSDSNEATWENKKNFEWIREHVVLIEE